MSFLPGWCVLPWYEANHNLFNANTIEQMYGGQISTTDTREGVLTAIELSFELDSPAFVKSLLRE